MSEYKGYNYSKSGEKYIIYDKDGKAWIEGFETERKAKEQIDDLVKQEENVQKEKIEIEEIKEQITNLELAMTELYESEGK